MRYGKTIISESNDCGHNSDQKSTWSQRSKIEASEVEKLQGQGKLVLLTKYYHTWQSFDLNVVVVCIIFLMLIFCSFPNKQKFSQHFSVL
jgi:hypothetical protein